MSDRFHAMSHVPRLVILGRSQSSRTRRLSDGCAGGSVVALCEGYAWAWSWDAFWTCAGRQCACAAVRHVSGVRDAVVAAQPVLHRWQKAVLSLGSASP